MRRGEEKGREGKGREGKGREGEAGQRRDKYTIKKKNKERDEGKGKERGTTFTIHWPLETDLE